MFFEREQHIKTAIAAIRRGDLTVSEIAMLLDVDRSTVHRWCKANGIDHAGARARKAHSIWHMLTDGSHTPKERKRAWLQKIADEWRQENVVKRPPGRPRKEVEDMKRTAGGPQGIVHNERKNIVLKHIKSGKWSIEIASKRSGIPISGIVGWCKLEGIPLPEKHQGPRRSVLRNV